MPQIDPLAAEPCDIKSALNDHLVVLRKLSAAFKEECIVAGWSLKLYSVIHLNFCWKKRSHQTFLCPHWQSQKEASTDLLAHIFHFIAPRLMVSSGLGRGAFCWVGLSAPGVALSCAHTIYLLWLVCSILLEVCCVHPSGAPHRGGALAQQEANHNIACFHSKAEKAKQTYNTACLLEQSAGGNSQKPWEWLLPCLLLFLARF